MIIACMCQLASCANAVAYICLQCNFCMKGSSWTEVVDADWTLPLPSLSCGVTARWARTTSLACWSMPLSMLQGKILSVTTIGCIMFVCQSVPCKHCSAQLAAVCSSTFKTAVPTVLVVAHSTLSSVSETLHKHLACKRTVLSVLLTMSNLSSMSACRMGKVTVTHLATGDYEVQDVRCCRCSTSLGWTYLKAFNEVCIHLCCFPLQILPMSASASLLFSLATNPCVTSCCMRFQGIWFSASRR